MAMGKRMRILISAFGFSPYRGSECAVGWNIARELAKLHEVTVITGDVKESSLEEEYPNYVKENGEGDGLTVIYLKPTKFIAYIDRLHELPGLWALYYVAYKMWQKMAYKKAAKLHGEKPFDAVHHLTMIGFREPGYMWKLGIPFYWGPVGGAPNEPMAFHRLFSMSGCVKVALRTICNEIQKRMCWRARLAAKKAAKIWTVTESDYQMVHGLWGVKCDRMLEAGTDDGLHGALHSWDGETKLRIVWSGIHTSRKALPILILALSKCVKSSWISKEKVIVDVLGEGPETDAWKTLAEKASVSDLLVWHGRLPRYNAIEMMRRAHVLACPSIKEASSIVVIEAVSLGLPVLCHNACGMGIVITDECGIKVPLCNPQVSIDGFAEAIKSIFDHPDSVERMSQASLARAFELTWEAKARVIANAYEELRR